MEKLRNFFYKNTVLEIKIQKNLLVKEEESIVH